MKNSYGYTFTTGGILLHLTRAQAVQVLRDAKKEGYTCELCYSHYWLNRKLAYSGSTGGFFFRKDERHCFMLYREAGVWL